MAENKTAHGVARLASGVVGFFYNPWAFAKAWGWSAVPLGLPEISMWQAAALLMLASWPVIGSMLHLSKLETEETQVEKTSKSLVVMLFLPTMLLVFSYLYLCLGASS